MTGDTLKIIPGVDDREVEFIGACCCLLIVTSGKEDIEELVAPFKAEDSAGISGLSTTLIVPDGLRTKPAGVDTVGLTSIIFFLGCRCSISFNNISDATLKSYFPISI